MFLRAQAIEFVQFGVITAATKVLSLGGDDMTVWRPACECEDTLPTLVHALKTHK